MSLSCKVELQCMSLLGYSIRFDTKMEEGLTCNSGFEQVQKNRSDCFRTFALRQSDTPGERTKTHEKS